MDCLQLPPQPEGSAVPLPNWPLVHQSEEAVPGWFSSPFLAAAAVEPLSKAKVARIVTALGGLPVPAWLSEPHSPGCFCLPAPAFYRFNKSHWVLWKVAWTRQSRWFCSTAALWRGRVNFNENSVKNCIKSSICHAIVTFVLPKIAEFYLWACIHIIIWFFYLIL